MRHRLQHAPQWAVRAAHAAVGVAVARARHRHVDREHQVGRAQLPGAPHHVAHEAAVLQDVQLEPDRIRCLGRHFGQRAHRDGGLDEGDVAAAGRAHRLHFAAARIHAGQADRRQRDRQAVILAEIPRAQVQLLGAAQHALAQLDRLQVVDVAAQRLLGAGAAIEVMEQEGRQPAACGFAEVSGGRDDHGLAGSERIRTVYAGMHMSVHIPPCSTDASISALSARERSRCIHTAQDPLKRLIKCPAAHPDC